MAEAFIVEEMVEGSPCTKQKLPAARGHPAEQISIADREQPAVQQWMQPAGGCSHGALTGEALHQSCSCGEGSAEGQEGWREIDSIL